MIKLAVTPVFLTVLVAPMLRAGSSPQAHPGCGIKTVYVTGNKKHSVSWARRHLPHYTHLQATSDIKQANAILDLEPVANPTPVESEDGPITLVACRDSKDGSDVSCFDNSGGFEKTSCRTSLNGRTTCWSFYVDLSGVESAIMDLGDELDAAAETHAYLLSKDGKTLLWEYDESAHTFGFWHSHLKHFVACR